MATEGIPDNVRALIASHIESVLQLEVLLLLHAQPARSRTARDIAAELRIDPSWIAHELQKLCSAGLLSCSNDVEPAFIYHPSSEQLREATEGLAEAYAQRRVTIITLIFSKPVDQIRSFTDAFRLRRDKE